MRRRPREQEEERQETILILIMPLSSSSDAASGQEKNKKTVGEAGRHVRGEGVVWSLCLSLQTPIAEKPAPGTTTNPSKQRRRGKPKPPPPPPPIRGTTRCIVQLAPTTLVSTLFQAAHDQFVVLPHKNTDPTTDTVQLQVTGLQFGFPPQRLDPSNTTSNQQTLEEAGLLNQEKIIVTIAWVPKKTKNQPSNVETNETTTITTSTSTTTTSVEDTIPHSNEQEDSPTTKTRRTSRRAAAQKATESFAQVIRAQEEQARQQATTRTQRRNSPAKKASSPSNSKPNPKFAASSTTGRRLQDGATVVPRKRSRQTNNHHQEATDDPSMALLETLEQPSHTRHGRLMRQGWKQAVNDRYEQNKAVARVAAWAIPHAVRWVVEPPVPPQNDDNKDDNNDTTNTTTPRTLHVTFPKGVQGRGTYQESVDYLPVSVLKQVIASIHPTNRETLRPLNLALLSPRVLWSLAYHDWGTPHHDLLDQEESSSTTRVRTMEGALQSLLPDLDWSFLRRRPQELSAKAKENLRQQQEQQQQEQQPSEVENWQAAAAAILSVEQAMNQVEVLDQHHRQAQILQAVERRQQQHQPQDDNDDPISLWSIVTPSEVDQEELLACIQEQLPPAEWKLSSEEIVEQLIQSSIRNWRELANVESATILAQQLLTAGTLTPPITIGMEVAVPMVQEWIERSQQESVEEIIVEVCDGNLAAVELLRDEAQTGTPQDLAQWRFIVPELHSLLRERRQQRRQVETGMDQATTNNNPNHHHVPELPSLSDLEKWCHQAHQAIDQFPWLKQIVTPLAVAEIPEP